MIHPALPYTSDAWPRHGHGHYPEFRISSSASASSSNNSEGNPPRTAPVVKHSPPPRQRQKSFRIDDILGNSDKEPRRHMQIDSGLNSPIQHTAQEEPNGAGVPARPIPIRVSLSQERSPPLHLHPPHHAQQQQQQPTVAPILKPTPVYDPLAMVALPYQQFATMSTYSYSSGGMHGVLPYARPEMFLLERSGIFPKMGPKPYVWSPLLHRSFHKRKGGQVRFNNEQTVELEKKFDGQKYLSPPERKKLAKELQLSERQEMPNSEKSEDDSKDSQSVDKLTPQGVEGLQSDEEDEERDDSAEEEEIDVGEDAGSSGTDDCNMATTWLPPQNAYIGKLDGD